MKVCLIGATGHIRISGDAVPRMLEAEAAGIGYAVQRASKDNPKQALPIIISASIAAFACIYIPGVLVLKRSLSLSLADAIAKGFIPFLIGDAVKIVAIVPITLKLRPIVARYLSQDD